MTENRYLILSAPCLKNSDGCGTLEYTTDEIRSRNPLITIPFDRNHPMFYFHDVIRTFRNLSASMILDRLDKKKYNSRMPVQYDEIFLALSDDSILYTYYDKDSHKWELADWDDLICEEITEKQAKRIAEKLTAFYEEYNADPKLLFNLQHEYLDTLYC